MRLSKKKIIIILSVAAILIVAGFFIYAKKSKYEYTTEIVQLGNLAQTVSETGTVKARNELELNFLSPGKISAMAVKIGDKVKKDEILAEQDSASLEIKRAEAQANLKVAQDNLNKLIAGATKNEIAVSQASESQAKTAYQSALTEYEKIENTINENITQAQKNYDDLIFKTPADMTTYEQAVNTAETSLANTKSTYQRSIDNSLTSTLITTEAKNAVAKVALDNINTLLNDDDAENYLSIKNLTFLNNTKTAYNDGVKLSATADTSLSQAKANKLVVNINAAANDSLVLLNKTFSALSNTYSALENTIATYPFTQAKIDSYKTTISTQQTTVNTAITAMQSAQNTMNDAVLSYDTNVSNAEKSLADAEAALADAVITARNNLATVRASGQRELAQAQTKIDSTFKAWQVTLAQLTQIKAAPRIEDVNLKKSQVDQSQAALDLILNQLNDLRLIAPIDGTITKKNYGIGEQSQANKPVFSLLAENNYEIELDVSEADIVKVSQGNAATITFDALGDDQKFSGQVSFIEPAETVIQDVIYYKVMIDLKEKYENIKPGMTANAVIYTAQKNNVLIAPVRAIIQKNGGKYARVLINNQVVENPVQTGLYGDEGLVEILSGLKAGDLVVTMIKEKK